MLNRLIILWCLCFSFLFVNGQTTLKEYVQIALESNIALQQKELSVDKSLAALKEAKAMFFPTIGIDARYSVARGGRAFELPIGDLMNPVYQNLNLINGIGAATDPTYPDFPTYPEIQNEQINFLRETEQETKLRMVLPVFNKAIIQSHKIQQHVVEMDKISVDVYKKELTKEVKSAYFRYLMATEGQSLYENTLDLVKENLRTSESLYKNQKVTIDEVFAAEAQVKSIEKEIAEAVKNVKTAEAYFNFLLNREYNLSIKKLSASEFLANTTSLEQLRNEAFDSREELQQLNYAMSIADEKIKLDKSNNLPSINLVTDYGIQGTGYSFGKDDDYAMGSLLMQWNFIDFKTKHKSQQSIIERKEFDMQKMEVKQQIGLEVVQAFYNLEASQKNIDLGKSEVESAKKAFRLMNKKYQQGQANLVQITDARTRLTNAQQQLIIAKYDYQIKLSDLDRSVGREN